MSHHTLLTHGVTSITSQRIIFDTFVELKLTITDSDGAVSTVSLMSGEPVEIQALPFRDVRTLEALPA